MEGDDLPYPEFRRRNLAKDLHVAGLDTGPHGSGEDSLGPPPTDHASNSTKSGEKAHKDEKNICCPEPVTAPPAG